MGNVVSRCAQNLRSAWKRCSKKHAEEEAMLSCTDSELHDKCLDQGLDLSLSAMDKSSRTGSPACMPRLEDKRDMCRLLSLAPEPGYSCSAPHLCNDRNHLSMSRHSNHSNGGRHSTLIDQGSQTNFELCSSLEVSTSEPCVLSKAYIVKTYSIQNATPSPSPKFPPASHAAQLPECHLSSAGSAPGTTPLANLERRQEDVLKKLENLQASVLKLAQKYSAPVIESLSATQSETTAASAASSLSAATAVSVTTSSSSVTTLSSAKTTGKAQCQILPGSLLGAGSRTVDLVISVDPDRIPLSLLVLSQELSSQHRVLKSTFVHSSVSDGVADNLPNLLASNNGIKRGDCDLAISLIWKKVAHGPHLVVDPTKQTTVQGEANVARYLSRLLNPSGEEDIVSATLADELLDLAQLQLIEGNSKEKAAAVRSLNSLLGKKDWLAGASPGLADYVCWSALQQTGQATNPPANVKKWLALCAQHQKFQAITSLIN